MSARNGKLDPNGDLTLSNLPPGRYEHAIIATNGNRITLAKVGGQWYSLNYRGGSPEFLRNSADRSTWAHLIGLPVKDVEAYVRRKRRENAKAAFERDVEHAKVILRAAGYEIEDAP